MNYNEIETTQDLLGFVPDNALFKNPDKAKLLKVVHRLDTYSTLYILAITSERHMFQFAQYKNPVRMYRIVYIKPNGNVIRLFQSFSLKKIHRWVYKPNYDIFNAMMSGEEILI